MHRIRRTFSRIVSPLLAAIACLQLATPALAQQAGAESQESWVTSYALVILCVGLALFVICRPSRRERKVRKD